MAQQLAQQEVCSTWSLQLWRALVNWLAFISQIVLQIVSFTPMAQLLSYIGLRHSFISSSPSFKPLPVVELSHSEPPEATVHAATETGGRGGGGHSFEKLTVVLDLDETLVCAYETSSLSAAIRTRAIEAGLKWFDLECVSSEMKEREGKPKISYVTVFERPGLDKFLKQLGEFADIVLFTAGLEDYARPLVDRIDVEKLITHRLYRPSTVSTKFREHVKDLSCLSKDLCRVVLVDNNPFSFLLQPLNGIPCVSFSAEQPRDEQLLEVILPLLKHLSEQSDVRPELYEKFHMSEWFQMQGIPASDLEG